MVRNFFLLFGTMIFLSVSANIVRYPTLTLSVYISDKETKSYIYDANYVLEVKYETEKEECLPPVIILDKKEEAERKKIRLERIARYKDTSWHVIMPPIGRTITIPFYIKSYKINVEHPLYKTVTKRESINNCNVSQTQIIIEMECKE